jgi:hypothetical protein
MDRFDCFFRLLPTRGDSDRSRTVRREEIEVRNDDLKAVNPNAKADEDLSGTLRSGRCTDWRSRGVEALSPIGDG